MRFNALLFTLFFMFTSPLQAMSDEEIASISTFLRDASQEIKKELKPQLLQGVLGYNSPKHQDACTFSNEAEAYVYNRKDLLFTLPITHINLTNMNLFEVPNKLFTIKGLCEVVLNENTIKDLPDNLREAKTLELLALHDNVISELPTWLGVLPKLAFIDLGDNTITDLPESLLNHNLGLRNIWADENAFEPKDLTKALREAYEGTEEWIANPTKTVQVNLPEKTEWVEEQDESGNWGRVQIIIEEAKTLTRTFDLPHPKTMLYLKDDLEK